MSFRAATTPCRGLLPAIVLAVLLAGCGIDAGPEARGPINPASAAAAPTALDPAGIATPSPDTPSRAATAAPPTAAASPAEAVTPGSTVVATGPQEEVETDVVPDGPEPTREIVYHVVKGARFFDILVARIGNREHVVLGENDDMCLDLPDQRDFDGDGNRDALVFRSPRCRGDAAPGLLFFVYADSGFRRSNPFPGHRPRIEPWDEAWSVVAGEARYVLRDGRAVSVGDAGSRPLRGGGSGQSRR